MISRSRLIIGLSLLTLRGHSLGRSFDRSMRCVITLKTRVLLTLFLVWLGSLEAVFTSAPIFAQQTGDASSKDPAGPSVDLEPVKEPKKQGMLSLPSNLPATGITSVLGEQATRPNAVYLRRENGDAVFVPQTRYEEFERYLNAQTTQESATFPDAILESISVTGTVRDGVADIQIDCKVVLADEVSKTVDVELGLGNCNIQQVTNLTGGKRSVLYPTKDTTGFNWSIQPDGSKEYAIRINALVKVNRIGLDYSLRFELPSGPTKIDIRVPTSSNRPAANTRWIGNNSEVLETSTDKDSLRAVVTGRGGVGILTWNEGATQQNLGALEADSETRVILNRQSLRWDAVTKLRIRATGRSSQQDIILELPENAVWIPSQASSLQAQWTLGIASAATPKQENALKSDKAPKSESVAESVPNGKPSADTGIPLKNQRQRLLLRFAERSRSFTEEIQIEWRLPTTDKSEQSVTLSSITIPDSQRHEGRLSIQMPSDQQFSWSPTSDFQFLNQVATNEAMEYEFRFARQGGNLSAILRTDQAQVRLKSIYLVRVTNEEVQLDGIYQFTQSPASLQELTFDAPGWTLHGLSWAESADLIPADTISESTLRVVPSSMVDSGPGLSTPEGRSIRLLASRPLPAGNSSDLKLTLPVLRWLKSNREQIRERGDGWLYIAPGPFKIITESMKFSEMTRVNDRLENIQSFFQLSNGIESPLAFRFRSGANTAKWEAPIKQTPRIIAGVADTNISILSNGWRIQRQWKLNIQGPPVSKLSFKIPSNLSSQSNVSQVVDPSATSSHASPLVWDLRIDGTPIATRVQQDLTDPNFTYLISELEVPIRKSSIELSTFHVDTLTGTSKGNLQSERSLLFDKKLPSAILRKIPIATLQIDGESTLQHNAAAITIEPNLIAEMEKESGETERFTSFDGTLSKRMSDSAHTIQANVTPLNPLSSPTIAIDRIWLQTLANAEQIRERVVFKAATGEKALSVKLPPAWDAKTFKVIVDGTPAAFFNTTDSNEYRVPLGAIKTAENATHVVEFWNWYATEKTDIKKLLPNIPEIQGVYSNIPCTWQIAVPAEEILVTQPKGWIGDWKWNFSGIGFNRLSTSEQSDFEKYFGSTSQAPLPKATNRYVLMSIVKPPLLDSKFSSQVNAKPGSQESLRTNTNKSLALKSALNPEDFQVLIIPRFWIWLPVGATLLMLSVLWHYSPWFRNPIVWMVFLIALGLAATLAPDIAIILSQTVLGSMLLLVVMQVSRWAWPVRYKRRDTLSTTGASTIISPGPTSAPVSVPSAGAGNKSDSRSGSGATQFSPSQSDSNNPRPSPSFASTAAPVYSPLSPNGSTPATKDSSVSPSTRSKLQNGEAFGSEVR